MTFSRTRIASLSRVFRVCSGTLCTVSADRLAVRKKWRLVPRSRDCTRPVASAFACQIQGTISVDRVRFWISETANVWSTNAVRNVRCVTFRRTSTLKPVSASASARNRLVPLGWSGTRRPVGARKRMTRVRISSASLPLYQT